MAAQHPPMASPGLSIVTRLTKAKGVAKSFMVHNSKAAQTSRVTDNLRFNQGVPSGCLRLVLFMLEKGTNDCINFSQDPFRPAESGNVEGCREN